MNILLGILLDLIAHQYFGGWYTCFLIVAVLQRIIKPNNELVDLFNVGWLSIGFLSLCALDVVKYGRAGISWVIVLLVFLLFRTVRHYFVSSQTSLLILLTGIVVLLDLGCVRPLLLGLETSWVVTIKEFFGTLATLALLGVRGSRFWSFVMNGRERKVWTPNRKSAL